MSIDFSKMTKAEIENIYSCAKEEIEYIIGVF